MELAEATERYFALLRARTDEIDGELREAEAAYRKAAKRYSDNPGVSAILELEALARRKAGGE